MRKDYFYIAIRNLRSRSLRSWLTIFGIVIGVFLVMALLSLSEGIKGAVLQQLRMIGSDIIMVYPGEASDMMITFAGGLKLSEDDIKAVEKAKGVEKVIPMNWKGEVLRYEGEKKTILLYGVPLRDNLEILKSKIGWVAREGRFPIPGKREMIVGAIVPEEIFPGMKIGREAYLGGKRFEIVGVMRSLGNKMDDAMVGIDSEIFKQITGERKGAPYVLAVIEEGFSQDDVSKNIEEGLKESRKRQRGKDFPAFSIITSQKAQAMVGDIMNIIQTAIFAIASFAILVGAIGIMNTMFTSVRERTKEIGIMKAIGAKTSDISSIFLIESGIMGLIGGLGGVVLGVGGAKAVEIFLQFHPVFYLRAYISLPFILVGLVIAFLVGALSGFLPARRAARLKPVDALHYE